MGRKDKSRSTKADAPKKDGSGRRRGRPIPLWQWALLAVAIVLMVGGGAAWAYSVFTRPEVSSRAAQAQASGGARGAEESGGVPAGPSSNVPDGLVSGFGPGEATGLPELFPGGVPGAPGEAPGAGSPEAAPSQAERAIDLYSPAVFRLGFSFVAGFAMAYALRQFVKVTLLVAGVVLLGMFGLQYAGLVQIDWGAIEGKYDSIAAFLAQQTASFSTFVSGYLPSATSAGAGAFIGFRKK